MFLARSTAGLLRSTTASAAVRYMSSGSSKKVAVLGASGGIGQPLSLLLKLSPAVDELSCYDIVGTPGVAADLSHVSFVVFVVVCDSIGEHIFFSVAAIVTVVSNDEMLSFFCLCFFTKPCYYNYQLNKYMYF